MNESFILLSMLNLSSLTVLSFTEHLANINISRDIQKVQIAFPIATMPIVYSPLLICNKVIRCFNQETGKCFL